MAENSNSSIILLVKISTDENSRFYLNYASQKEAVQGIILLYEQFLKKSNPNQTKLAYTLSDVFSFVDKLAELIFMEFDEKLMGYKPHGKDWVKSVMINNFTQS